VIKEQEKYTHCDNCGVRILEKCAIEENGKVLCGDCIVSETKKDMAKAEKLAEEKRKKHYEQERKALVRKQKKRAAITLAVALLIFAVVQFIMQTNKPAPVKSVKIDFSQKLPVAKALITIGLQKYAADKQALPKNLQLLYPEYLPKGVDRAFPYFNYKKLENNLYDLEINKQKTALKAHHEK